MSAGAGDELFRRAKRVFLALVDLPREEWPERLARECGDDAELRAEVESLLGHVDADTDGLRPVLDSESVELAPEVPGEILAGLERELGSRLARTPQAEQVARHLAELSAPRFREGDRFADRYRMIERLGTGGMGEVWRARDEMLGEEVALKFIRRGGAARDRAWIERLLAETSLARRITHPNVCRVHDASEVDGEFFLSMELVPGSDLAQRLRREGRLPPDAARRLAVELVDALHAIHSAGLLHRDLKPANILFDRSGAARVSDFGLAAASETVRESDSPSGTRSYMAPELLRGAPPSEASDVYALGLVLYEAMSNRRCFRSAEEIVSTAERGELPPAPSLLIPDADVLLEHLVKRCLAPRPRERPTTEELQRALSLRDPLEAVISLGDAPSAEVIAGSSSRFLLTPRQGAAWTTASLVLVALLALVAKLGGEERLPATGPEHAASRAAELAAELGGAEGALAPYRAWRYEDLKGFHWLPGSTLARGVPSDEDAWSFWYRESSTPLAPTRAFTHFYLGGRTQLFDPPRGAPGMTTVVLNEALELIAFETRPRLEGGTSGPRAPVDWTRLFELAGLDRAELESLPTPRSDCAGERFVWLERDSSRRVEAATVDGALVSIAVVTPTAEPTVEGGLLPTQPLWRGLMLAGLLAFFFPRAQRHFRSGLGDPLSSMRLAVFCAAAASASWFLGADLPPEPEGAFFSILWGLLLGVGIGALLWVFYQAIEPSVQRERPLVLVSWSRLLRGQWRARLVRSHLLIGVTLGLLPVLGLATGSLAGGRASEIVSIDPLLHGSHPLAWVSGALDFVDNPILLGLELLAGLTVLRFFLRREWAALLGVWVVGEWVILEAFGWSVEMVVQSLAYLLGIYALTRIGLLAFVAMYFTFLLFELLPPAPGLEGWYAGASLFALALVTVAALFNGVPLLRAERAR